MFGDRGSDMFLGGKMLALGVRVRRRWSWEIF